jgi:Fic family protein
LSDLTLASRTHCSIFVELLKQAHEPRELSEDYLVELQNVIITNPFDKAASFRYEQNWLSGPGRGPPSVTYLPPPHELARELMTELMALAGSAPKAIDPVVAASIISFGFVFIHPFMDGNGRLSRFLFHHALCQSGMLEKGLVLPVSIAMKRHEADYLTALRAFSRPHAPSGTSAGLTKTSLISPSGDRTQCIATGTRRPMSSSVTGWQRRR